MYVSRLRLTDYRSYASLDLGLEPGTTLFSGPNGYGKTNIVEAVHFLATLDSHRVAGDTPLIRTGCAQATVAAVVRAGRNDDRSLSVAVDIRASGANRAQLNKAPARVRDVVGAVRTVLFSPEDLAIVRGDPAERRGFLDELVVTRWPRLAGTLAQYDRALKQKTALLKALSGRGSRAGGRTTREAAGPGEGWGTGGEAGAVGARDTLDTWSEALAAAGAEIVVARLRTLAELAPLVTTNYAAIAPTPAGAGAAYRSTSLPDGTGPEEDTVRAALLQAMYERRGEEIARGVCLVGPHRDDVALSLGDMPVKGYASHGEGWSYALALRLASLDLLHADGIEPILILDDVFAELDDTRRTRVAAAMAGVDQTLVTAAVLRDVPPGLVAQVYEVEPGTVRAVAP